LSSTPRLRGRARRSLATVAISAMALSGLPASIAVADDITEADIADSCTGAPDQSAEFTDFPTDPALAAMVNCLAGGGYQGTDGDILQGGTDGALDLDGTVNRAQWAGIQHRVLVATGIIMPAPRSDADFPFSEANGGDVPSDGTFRDAIDILNQLGIVAGTGANTYDPLGTLRGVQAVLFAYRTANLIRTENDLAAMAGDGTQTACPDATDAEIIAACDALEDAGWLPTGFDPAVDATRGDAFQMGAARPVEDAVENGIIETAYDVPTPPNNQSFTVTPGDTQNVMDDGDTDSTKTADNVSFSVSNPTADKEHDIILVDADLVVVDADGNVSFLDAAGAVEDAGFIQETATLDSTIDVINGSAAGGVLYAAASPVNGGLSFTTNGSGFEDFYAIVFYDADGDTRLDLDATGVPVAAEPFGLGGMVSVLPIEEPAATFGADADILGFDTDANWIVVDDTTGGPTLVYYDDTDLFYASGADGTTATLANQETMAAWEAMLTIGDDLESTTTVYAGEPSFQSIFTLNNYNPGVLTFGAPSGTNVDGFEVTILKAEVVSGATIQIFSIEDDPDTDPAFDDTTWVMAEFTAADDEDTATTDYEFTISGLTAGTEYDLAARQVAPNGEEGAETVYQDATTDPTPDDVMITSVSVNDVNDGTTGATNDELIVIFDTDITLCNDARLLTVYPTAQPGITNSPALLTDCAIDGVNAKKVTFTLSTAINDAATDVAYTVEIDAGAVTTAGGDNGDLTATFSH